MKLTTQEMANFMYFKGNAMRKFEDNPDGIDFEGKHHDIPPKEDQNGIACILALLQVKGAVPGSTKGLKQEEIEQYIMDNDLLNL